MYNCECFSGNLFNRDHENRMPMEIKDSTKEEITSSKKTKIENNAVGVDALSSDNLETESYG